MTKNWELFQRDFLHANTWPQRKDGVPLELLDRLSHEERALAEDQLIEALSSGDSWPARGLGHIRSMKALPALYALLEKCQQDMKVNVAYAIYQVNYDRGMVDIVLAELPKIGSEYSLIDVMHLLPNFQDPRVTELLRVYRHDKRYLVAYNAARALGESTDKVVRDFLGRKAWWKIFSKD
ncbi:HEAT repeat domain-containing protein [Puia dinghuensis]|uniref:HEAT repeat domain-containing protein n=1 Tax=Puia dinghuensis TaxID=1792502 RepID=A0A8J2UD36_9BACT|nr:hypothetical protein [Puia dinghuensis]GGB01067.1 hypothetical protein GCM10011511_25490 [Puia dinghuensis]